MMRIGKAVKIAMLLLEFRGSQPKFFKMKRFIERRRILWRCGWSKS